MDIKTIDDKFNDESNLAKLIHIYDPDILCLSETKCQCKDVNNLSDLMPFKFQEWNCSKKKLGYSGITILSKLPFKNVQSIPGLENDDQGRNMFIEFDKFYLAYVYVPNSGTNEEYRKNIWDPVIYNFLKKYSKKKKPIIYCGDLNVVNEDKDIYKPEILVKGKSPGAKEFERKNFKELLELGYIDTLRYIYKDQNIWTWWDPRTRGRENDRGWRLDYFLISNKKFISESKIHKDIYGSDHCPISLELKFP